MGACITRCLPLYSDPRYQPVRSRYLIQDDVVQTQPNSRSRISASSDDDVLCMSDPLDPSEPTPSAGTAVAADDDLPLPFTPGLAQSLVTFTLADPPLLVVSPEPPSTSQHPPSTHTPKWCVQAEDEVELTPRVEEAEDSSSPQRPASRSTPRSGMNAGGGNGERWWGARGTAGSLPSLAEPDSPPTTSLDLEWEPEAGLGRVSRESVRTGEEEASQTAESSSWVPRSACSTPNSLEWDFRASTLSLRGQGEEEAWQQSDLETEQLLYEIEQLAARALADTGHGLQPPR